MITPALRFLPEHLGGRVSWTAKLFCNAVRQSGKGERGLRLEAKGEIIKVKAKVEVERAEAEGKTINDHWEMPNYK